MDIIEKAGLWIEDNAVFVAPLVLIALAYKAGMLP
jgi:hypothetical protein